MPLKKRPSRTRAGHHRDIALEDPAPKRHGSFIRKPLKKAAGIVCQDTQVGSGLNESSTEAAHLYLRAQIDIEENINKTAVVHFAEVATVLAAMMRCLLLKTEPARRFLWRNSPAWVRQGPCRHGGARNGWSVFWEPAGLNDHFKALANDWFKAYWTIIDCSSCVWSHGAGCGAGNPAADAFVLSLLLTCVGVVQRRTSGDWA